ncbi:outer membrane protein assembly factor [Fluviispira multicolorata]|uniref:BamA/TamA family outer membrane protein n=1 Tax=Fluviispira multicolorata TaxID=2654512 RepID=A0A833JD18_9BACT|nr:outer membrane protein assembly factor [Fluviispira multicolorata]KAB8030675.1 BamA/TamA family outer membrane protein [Fluviispira multicolorata]
MAVNKLKKLFFLLLLMFTSVFFKSKIYAQINKITAIGSLKEQIPVEIHFYLDGNNKELPEDLLNELSKVPFNELDDAIITMLIEIGFYQEVIVKKAISEDNKHIFIVNAKIVKRIQDVYFDGLTSNESLEIDRIISSQRGTPFKESTANADSKKIEKALIQKGYPNAKVNNFEIVELSADSIQVKFNIDKGNPCHIAQVSIDKSRANILNFLTIPIETGSICDLSAINESLDQLKESYWEQGYLEAKVKLKEISYSANKENAKITLEIDYGRKTTFQIFDEDSQLLNNDFLVSKQGLTYSDIILLSDADLHLILTDFYKKQGYVFVNISDPERIVDKNGNTTLKFLLKRGPFVKVGKVTFIGTLPESDNIALNEMGLSSSFLTGSIPFYQENLSIYRDNLRKYLLSKGYLEAQVSNPDYVPNESNSEMNLVFRVDKGIRFVINEITFQGVPSDFELNNEKISQIFQFGSPYSIQTMQQLYEEVRRQFLSHGYLYNNVKIEHSILPESKFEKRVDVSVKIDPSQIVRIRKIYIDSDFFGKESTILSVSGLEEGDIFSQESFDIARQRLIRHELFSTVSIEPLDVNTIDRKEFRIDVVIRARSRSGYTLGFSPGYGTLRGYTFGVDFTLNRLNSDGLKFFSTAAVTQEKQQQNFASTETRQILGKQINLGLTEPLLKLGPIHTPLDATAILGYKVAAETLTNREYLTFNLKADWKPAFFDLNWNISQSFFHESSKSTSSESAIVQALDSPSIVTRELTTSVTIDNTNNPAWPTKGSKHNLLVSFARFGLGSDVQYNRYSGSTDVYFPIYKKLSGAITLGGNFVIDTVNKSGDTVTPPASRRATLTDTALVRGFPETYGSTAPGPLLWIHYNQQNSSLNCQTQLASIGATNLIYLKAEARYRLNENIGFVAFLDSATNYFTQAEVNDINQVIANKIASQVQSTTECVPDAAALIASDSINLQRSDFIKQYWKQAYVSTGIGFRFIVSNYATISLDYGYPLKDPSSNEAGCVSPSDALNSSTAPKCVTRIQNSSYFDTIKFRGALHLKVGAQF